MPCWGAFPGVSTSPKAQPLSKRGTHLARFTWSHPAEWPETRHPTQHRGPTKTERILHGKKQPTKQTKTQIQLWATVVTERPSTRSLFLCCSYQSLLQKVSFKQTCSLPHSCCHVEGGFSCWEKQRSWGDQSIPQNTRGLGWLRREQAGFTSFVGIPSCTHAFCFQVSKSLQNSGPGCKFISVLCSARKHPPQPPLPSHPSWKQPPAELSMLWGEQSWVPRQYFGSPPPAVIAQPLPGGFTSTRRRFAGRGWAQEQKQRLLPKQGAPETQHGPYRDRGRGALQNPKPHRLDEGKV